MSRGQARLDGVRFDDLGDEVGVLVLGDHLDQRAGCRATRGIGRPAIQQIGDRLEWRPVVKVSAGHALAVGLGVEAHRTDSCVCVSETRPRVARK